MEFNEKLQQLRKQKGLTQQELAKELFVSRTAISKWESSRGYPSIDSLKEIANFFSITIDELLSGEELLTIAQHDNKKTKNHIRDLVFGLLDISVALLLFLPLFGQKVGQSIQEVSLLSLDKITPYLSAAYYAFVLVIVTFGILTLALQNCNIKFWISLKSKISLILSGLGAVLFIISMQPYAAMFLFLFFVLKALMLLK